VACHKYEVEIGKPFTKHATNAAHTYKT